MFAWIKKFLPHQQILTHVQDRLPQTDNWAHKIHNPVKTGNHIDTIHVTKICY